MKRKALGFRDLPVKCCPWCGSTDFRRDGIKCGRQRYRCRGCGRTFTPTTGTLLSHTREPEGLWRDYVLQMTNDATLVASHEYGSINRNTSLLWRRKLFACLSSVASQTVLSGTVWIDEIYFNVSESGRIRADSGNLLHGISRNKVCVELAVDSNGRAYGKVMGTGKPTSGMIAGALAGHVREGSFIVHDGFHGHADAIAALRPSGVRAVRSTDPGHLKAMQPANTLCALVRRVVCLHVGERPGRLQEYVDWACLRSFLRRMPPDERIREVLRICAATGIDFKR